MRYGVVVEELAVEVMAQLPTDEARQEVMALVEVARIDLVRDPGSVEEIREALRYRRDGGSAIRSLTSHRQPVHELISVMRMSNGIAWIGAHSAADKAAAQPGMLGGISLTCARDLDADEFLIALGADPDELAARTPYKDLAVPVGRPGKPSPRVNPVMYGTCGDWVYVLEDWGMATWATGYRTVESMRPAPDEEIVCVTMNSWSPPQRLIHAPGDGRAWQAEFGEGAGADSALDAALHAAGAVFPSIGEVGEAAVVAYYEEHGPRLPVAVFTAVGNYCGLSIDQEAVQAGDPPAVLIPMV